MIPCFAEIWTKNLYNRKQESVKHDSKDSEVCMT